MKRIIPAILPALALATGCSQQNADSAAAGNEAPSSAPAAAQPVGSGAAASPSFDCAKADGDATRLVCDDGNLAAMDRELSRLYGLALSGTNMDAGRKRELETTQRGWIKDRDDCWKAEDKRQCVLTSYAQRIAEIRQGYSDARSRDTEGTSTGPVALACKDVDFLIGATFIQTDPGAAFLSWKEQSVALDHVPSGSGAKYEGTSSGKKAALFTQGDEAMVTLPGQAELTCKVEEIG